MHTYKRLDLLRAQREALDLPLRNFEIADGAKRLIWITDTSGWFYQANCRAISGGYGIVKDVPGRLYKGYSAIHIESGQWFGPVAQSKRELAPVLAAMPQGAKAGFGETLDINPSALPLLEARPAKRSHKLWRGSLPHGLEAGKSAYGDEGAIVVSGSVSREGRKIGAEGLFRHWAGRLYFAGSGMPLGAMIGAEALEGAVAALERDLPWAAKVILACTPIGERNYWGMQWGKKMPVPPAYEVALKEVAKVLAGKSRGTTPKTGKKTTPAQVPAPALVPAQAFAPMPAPTLVPVPAPALVPAPAALVLVHSPYPSALGPIVPTPTGAVCYHTDRVIVASARGFRAAAMGVARQIRDRRDEFGLTGVVFLAAQIRGRAVLAGVAAGASADNFKVYATSIGAYCQGSDVAEWGKRLEDRILWVQSYLGQLEIAGPIGKEGMVYSVGMEDPPWAARDQGTRFAPGYSGKQRKEKRYDPLDMAEILALGPRISAKFAATAIYFLWCPSFLAAEGAHVRVMESRGFAPKVLIPWIKTDRKGRPKMGGGHYTRSVHEELVIGTRGAEGVELRGASGGERLVIGVKGKAASELIATHSEPGLIEAERPTEHSGKPDAAYELIERLTGEGRNRLELWARRGRDGWDSWGNEAPGAGKI